MKKTLYITALALAFAGLSMADDTVLQTIGSGLWNSAVAASDSGNTFYSNTSYDGATCNVGYILESASNICGGPKNSSYVAPGDMPFLTGGTATTPDAGFDFTNDGSTTATYVVTIAGDSGADPGETFGYGLVGVANSNVALFTVNDDGLPTVLTNSFSVAAGQQFYFYLDVNGTTTYTTSADGDQFALFAQSPAVAGSDAMGTALSQFWIGAEDIALPGGDKDYNDFVVGFSTATPEPGFYGLLTLGLCGIGFAVRRRNASQR